MSTMTAARSLAPRDDKSDARVAWSSSTRNEYRRSRFNLEHQED
jgi:hypothetical protein